MTDHESAMDEATIANKINNQKNIKRNELARANVFSPVDTALSRRSIPSDQSQDQQENTKNQLDTTPSIHQVIPQDRRQSVDNQANSLSAQKAQAANTAFEATKQTAEAEEKIQQAMKAVKTIKYIWMAITFIAGTWWLWVIALILIVTIMIGGSMYYAYEKCGWSFYLDGAISYLTNDPEKLISGSLECVQESETGSPAATPASAPSAQDPGPQPSSGATSGEGEGEASD
ncbi:MAG: hypothetical protein WC473_01685 [Patescibacteria group bacterium]|jgi:hypothetical protein